MSPPETACSGMGWSVFGCSSALNAQVAALDLLKKIRRIGMVLLSLIPYPKASPDTLVDFDRSLNVCVAQLRSVLNDDSEAPRFIQTVPRRGYRFVAPVVTPEPPKRPIPQSRDWRWTVLAGIAVLFAIPVVYFA